MVTPVTPAVFKAAKPQFASVSDEAVQSYLDLAGLFIGETWPDALYTQATIAMTCHLMTLDGLGSDAESRQFLSGYAGFQSVKSGTLTLTRFSSAASNAGMSFPAWLGSTTCGRLLAQLMRLNGGGPMVAYGGRSPTGASPYAKDWPGIFWGGA